MPSADGLKPPKLSDLPNEANKDKKTLVRLLQEAARLEHCLLNTYLYAACSLKTLPEEFATVSDGSPNRRRAIQFERVRDWKLSILSITHEEMMHLHYVQCLLRALGEPADFTLPQRSARSGSWYFQDWRLHVGTQEPPQEGEVPVDRLTKDAIKRFILYEATDALQDADPFGDAVTELFDKLHDFEVEYRLDEALLNISDGQRDTLRPELLDMLRNLPPCSTDHPPGLSEEPMSRAAVGDFERVGFQSISDLYTNEILPRYRNAFALGQVVNDNRDLNGEIADPARGMLPVGPIHRDKNFQRQEEHNINDPLANFVSVDNIITQIVDEGEGMTDFIEAAEEVLAKASEPGGVSGLLAAVRADQEFSGGINGDGQTPDWLTRIHRVRNSHLYRFAMIGAQYDAEQRLAQQCGEVFTPARKYVYPNPSEELRQFTAEAISHFNACYLVLRTWLTRYYAPQPTQSDQRRRLGIEVLAGWPMMSVAIRPFLELLAILPISGSDLFKSDPDSLADGPPGTAELNAMFDIVHPSDETAETMDGYALQILDATSQWASAARSHIKKLITDPTAQAIVDRRLAALSILDEFKRQLVYREHGGYSATEADDSYPCQEPDKYEEVPLGATATSPPLFANSLVLRLRFSGRCLVQLATDPDPPTDEAGCSGTMMLTADDGNAQLDRALVMQPGRAGNSIIRGPQQRLPPLGVQVREVALMVTDYPSGTTRTIAVPGVNPAEKPKRFMIEGLNPILVCDPKDLLGEHHRLGIDLLNAPDGTRPYFNGENHLVWQDGEPIDPFILAVTMATDDGEPPIELLCREVYNDGLRMLQMDPQQRARARRAPVAVDRFANTPEWVRATLSPPELLGINSASGYLDERAAALVDALSEVLRATPERSQVCIDAAVSLLERRRRVVRPRGTTAAWLPLLVHYGHTVSGQLRQRGDGKNALMKEIGERCGLKLTGAEDIHDRERSNGRWMISYAKGYMDADQLSDLTYGELLIPLDTTASTGLESLQLTRSWHVAASVNDVDTYACDFHRPFGQAGPGAPPGPFYAVVGNTREVTRPGYPLLRETLVHEERNSYTYGISGPSGLADCSAKFATRSVANGTMLTWTVKFTCDPPLQPITVMALFACHGVALENALYERFPTAGPDRSGHG